MATSDPATPNPAAHTSNGNCWAVAYECTARGCAPGEFCDVCHQHDEPRGDCSECPRCAVCDAGDDDGQ